MAATPDGKGYWLVASDGGIFAYGDATFYGSTGGLVLNRPVVGMAVTPDGRGYWLVASDGGLFSYGDATFFGSRGSLPLNRPVVGMATTPDGKGYWLVASDGGIFSYGDAAFDGSTGSRILNRPVVGMTGTPDGKGYWLVASDGGIFSYGDAVFDGSTGSLTLNRPVVGMTATPDGKGYWLVASDGGIFTYGDAVFFGSTGGLSLNNNIVGMAGTPDGKGYWMAASDGGISTPPGYTAQQMIFDDQLRRHQPRHLQVDHVPGSERAGLEQLRAPALALLRSQCADNRRGGHVRAISGQCRQRVGTDCDAQHQRVRRHLSVDQRCGHHRGKVFPADERLVRPGEGEDARPVTGHVAGDLVLTGGFGHSGQRTGRLRGRVGRALIRTRSCIPTTSRTRASSSRPTA